MFFLSRRGDIYSLSEVQICHKATAAEAVTDKSMTLIMQRKKKTETHTHTLMMVLLSNYHFHINCELMNSNHSRQTLICHPTITGFERADGQNGSCRSAQATDPPLSPFARFSSQDWSARESGPLFLPWMGGREVSVWKVTRAWHSNMKRVSR